MQEFNRLLYHGKSKSFCDLVREDLPLTEALFNGWGFDAHILGNVAIIPFRDEIEIWISEE